MAEGQWYWCLRHSAVEPYYGCRAATRLGPFASPEEAGQALARVHERNEDWDNDPRFNDDDEPDEASGAKQPAE